MQIKSIDKNTIRWTHWIPLLLASFSILALGACTNDYVSLEPLETPSSPEVAVVVTVIPTVDIAPVLTQIPPTSAPQPTAVPPTAVAVIDTGAGIGGGDTSPESLINTNLVQPEPVIEPTPMLTSMAKPVRASNEPAILYYTQAGDTLPGLAARFGVSIDEISASMPLSRTGFLDPQMMISIPGRTREVTSSLKVVPDSEVVFSPSGIDFDIESYVANGGGYLSTYREYLNSSGWLDGAGVIRKVAVENSINPRILLSILEYFSHWVYGYPVGETAEKYPLGHVDPMRKGLYNQLTWAVSQMNLSYYGWREGILTEVVFPDGTTIQASPELNAGTFAMQYLFAQLLDRAAWEAAIYTEAGFPATHQQMFGSSWLRAMTVEPIFPATITQPELILPFEKNVEWSYTGGPHAAWGSLGARAALDFSPSLNNSGCESSDEWVLAVASGIVTRAGGGVVVLDLDGDGNEQTGWNILYMHIATRERVQAGEFVEQGQHIGHPSCEGGFSTGTHFHIARKFNGEWILAGGPLPFVMDGWKAQAAAQAYKGTLIKGNEVITACTCGTLDTVIIRRDDSENSNDSGLQ